MKEKRKGGAPLNNQNARKHGFYAKVLDNVQKRDLQVATDVDGIDDEIALLRVKIKELVEKDPGNLRLIVMATNALARLLKVRLNISKEQKKGFKEALGKVIKEVTTTAAVSAAGALITKKIGG